MCGKFTAMMTWREYVALAGLVLEAGDNGAREFDPDSMLGTFTPMANLPVVHLNPVGMRRISLMRWGWLKAGKNADPRKGFSHLHARSEEIDQTPTWREPFAQMRGLVWTKSFNIGEELPDGKIKQWVCTRADAQPMAIAVLYSVWEHALYGLLRTCVMVTTASCPPLSARDERMPAILASEDEIRVWLGERAVSPATVKGVLRPFEGSLVMREQSPSKAPPQRPARAKAQGSLF
jgi:putative SOS response-associated peptidase YedK